MLSFVRTTLAGGILLLLPIIVVVIIGGKALAIAGKIVVPLADRLEMGSIFGHDTPMILTMVLLVLFCFLAGCLARTAIAKKAVNWLETAVLSNVPGYEFIKTLRRNLLAAQEQPVYPAVLARIDDAWQVAFLIERIQGGQLAIFVPGVPNPQSGSLVYLAEEQVRQVDVPPTSVLKCLKRFGLGSNALVGNRLSAASQAVVVNKPQ